MKRRRLRRLRRLEPRLRSLVGAYVGTYATTLCGTLNVQSDVATSSSSVATVAPTSRPPCFGARTFSPMGVIIVASFGRRPHSSVCATRGGKGLGRTPAELASLSGRALATLRGVYHRLPRLLEWYDVMGFLLEKFSFVFSTLEPAA